MNFPCADRWVSLSGLILHPLALPFLRMSPGTTFPRCENWWMHLWHFKGLSKRWKCNSCWNLRFHHKLRKIITFLLIMTILYCIPFPQKSSFPSFSFLQNHRITGWFGLEVFSFQADCRICWSWRISQLNDSKWSDCSIMLSTHLSKLILSAFNTIMVHILKNGN